MYRSYQSGDILKLDVFEDDIDFIASKGTFDRAVTQGIVKARTLETDGKIVAIVGLMLSAN